MESADEKLKNKHDLKTTLKTFGETTSVKGVPKIFKTEQRCLRIMWFLAVVSGASIAFYQLTTLVIRYFDYETVTKLQYCNDCKPPFPDITVCNINPLNSLTEYKNSIQDFDVYMDYIDLLSYQLDLNKIMADLSLTYPQLEEVYREAFSVSGYFQNVNETVIDSIKSLSTQNRLIINCKWYGWDRKTYPKEDCLTKSIFTFYSPEYFVCYTLHMNDSITTSSNSEISSLYAMLYLNDFAEKRMRTMVQNIYTTQARGLRVLVHPPNTLPEMAKGFNIPAGHEVQIRLRPKHKIRLGEPYSKCTDQVYLDATESEKQDPYAVSYKFTDKACLSLCHQEHNLKDCGCFHPHLPFTDRMMKQYSRLPRCGWVGNDVTEAIKRVACYLYVNSKAENLTCDCLQPCNHYLYDYQLLQSPWPHEAYHDTFYSDVIRRQPFKDKFEEYKAISKLFKDNNFTEAYEQTKNINLIERNFIQLKVLFQEEGNDVYTDIPSVTFDAFFGSMGGILNLWIGITFFTFIELFDLLYKLLESLFCSSNKSRSSSVTAVEPFRKDDKFNINMHNKW